MILFYLLTIALLNLGLGFLAAAYLQRRYEETTDVALPLVLSLPPRQAGGAFGDDEGPPATGA